MNESLNSITGFPEGNAETVFYYVKDYYPKAFNYIEKTILPILDATFIQMFGDYSKFKKTKFDIKFLDGKTEALPTQALFKITYNVPTIAGVEVTPDAINNDKNYILSKLTPLVGQYIKKYSVDIDLKNGNIIVNLVSKIGALL